MRLTRHEIMLLVSTAAALLVGAAVKHYRDAHPADKATPPPTPAPKVRRAK